MIRSVAQQAPPNGAQRQLYEIAFHADLIRIRANCPFIGEFSIRRPWHID
jgi:hypothetical protein